MLISEAPDCCAKTVALKNTSPRQGGNMP
jgi:hypothetical protein